MSLNTQNQQDALQPIRTHGNFEYAIMNAVNNDQVSMQNQEITDAKTTINDTKFEAAYYSAWDSILQQDATAIAKDPTNTALQTQYSTDSTIAQSQQNMCDSATQASQTATGQDGTNLSNMAQIATAATSIASNMAQVIASS